MEQLNVILTWIYCVGLFVVVKATTGTRSESSVGNHGNRCSFPEEWRGRWFQKGIGQFEIDKHKITKFGHCSNNDGNKYLLFDKKGRCFKCMVVTAQHSNLLQYKKSYCLKDNVLEKICDQIASDATLHTIVKVSGSPIPCPFQGHYTFTYSNGSNSLKCDQPLSSIKACADSSRFLFEHRRCPNILNTFDNTVAFQCLATWDNGVDSYLYGRFSGPYLNTEESQYRCFMYRLYGSQGMMSMTADSTCLGLQSHEVGNNLYDLRKSKRDWPQAQCQFPEFLTYRKEWRDVTGRLQFEVSSREDKFTIRGIPHPGYLEGDGEEGAVEARHVDAKMRVLCLAEMESYALGDRQKVDIVTYVTDDLCKSNNRCVRLDQPIEGIVKVKVGNAVADATFACEESNFRDAPERVLIPTPTSGNLTAVACPIKGMYTFRDKNSGCTGKIDVGCSKESEMVIDSRCGNKQSADVVLCYATWTESSKVYIIAGKYGDERKAAHVLVYSTANGLELKSEGEHRLEIRGSPVNFKLTSASKSCQAPPVRPTSIIHEDRQPPLDEKRMYDTKNNRNFNSDVIETPSHSGGAQTTSEIINRGTQRTCAQLVVVLVCCVVASLISLS